MAKMSYQMKTNDSFDARRRADMPAERPSIGWNDSSWELLHGLDVLEDLPPDAWPLEDSWPAQRTTNA